MYDQHASSGHKPDPHGDHNHRKHEHSAGETPPASGHSGHDHQEDGHASHGGHGHHSPEMFRRRFWVALILTIPVLLYSHHIQSWFRFSPPPFAGSEHLPAVLGIIIFFYGGSVFLRGAAAELGKKEPGMMTLIALAISVAFGYSLAVTLGVPGEAVYWELATLVTIMLLGHWVEMAAVQRAGAALQELAKLLPDLAQRIVDGEVEEVPVGLLEVGDVVLVRPGGQVPSDGQVMEGESEVDESMLTGESRPIAKGPDDTVIAGTVNGAGSLRVRVEKTGAATTLAGIMRLVEQAQSSRTRTQALADRAAYWLVLVAITAATVTALAWSAAGAESTFILERVVTVLIIACPHALGLAIPLVIAIATSLSAQNGLLVRDRLALEAARNINCVVFDKTGTLTRGEQALKEVFAVEPFSEEQVLSYAAAAEADSEHMIARGLLQAVKERGLNPPSASDFLALAGRGVHARVEEKDVYVGGPHILDYLEREARQTLREEVERAEQAGQSALYVIVDDEVIGLFIMTDVVRAESYEAVQALQGQGIEVMMLTGDSAGVAASVAEELGIRQYFAGVLPDEKADYVARLQDQGYRVAMVGDGVNDAPALARADVGVAIGAGTDIAVESAGIILVRNDPRDIARLVQLSHATYRKMVQNLVWAVGYNIVAIPLAAGILAPVGFILPMAVGAVVMSASTIIVALNAQLLRKLDLQTLPAK